MLIESKTIVATIKVNSSFHFADGKYPHYRLMPVNADGQNYVCLFFYISSASYLILETKIKRYQAIRKLASFLETADYVVYELKY
ncbi:MAG: lipopolysaccharide heptosyltransferase [Neisseria sp.]|nr:lipopolysaccharide heptosyltransferase [Neisseria sp.]